MRKLNLKDPRTQRWFLVPCLLVTLGSTLSWNPENTNIVRNEYGRVGNFEFASSEGQVSGRRLNLTEDGNQGVTATITWDPSQAGDQVRATVRFEGQAGCTSCERGMTREIERAKLENTDSLRLFALNSMRVLREESATAATAAAPAAAPARPVAAAAPAPVRPGDEISDETSCEMDLRDGLMSCQRDELNAIITLCQAKPQRERRPCYRRAESHFRKNLAKTLGRGLATGRGSAIFTDATEVRNDLISDLPSVFDDTIRQALITMSANGILRRAQAEIDRCNLGGCAQGQGLLAARSVLERETSLNPMFGATEGRNIMGALQSYAQAGDTSMEEMTASYMRLFQSPLSQRIQAAGGNSLNLSSINDPYLNDNVPGLRGDRSGTRMENTRYSRNRNPRDTSNPSFFNPNAGPAASGPGQVPNGPNFGGGGGHGGTGNYGHPHGVRPATGNGNFVPASRGSRQ